uniref:Uncharacterized protein n=1 Tax=Clastoptera arizonana TaxID=38151 RepID=A0A1B6DYP4_9HEMI
MNNAPIGYTICGLLGTILICYILDYKRTKNSGYKDKVKQSRKKECNKKRELRKEERKYFPNTDNLGEVRNFFIDEVEFAEISFAQGDEDDTIFHLGNAFALSGRSDELLMKAIIPPHLYQEVVERIEYVKKLLEEK